MFSNRLKSILLCINFAGGFAEWGYPRPNNYKGYQTCTILSQSVEFKFDDDDCGKTIAGFICDIRESHQHLQCIYSHPYSSVYHLLMREIMIDTSLHFDIGPYLTNQNQIYCQIKKLKMYVFF